MASKARPQIGMFCSFKHFKLPKSPACWWWLWQDKFFTAFYLSSSPKANTDMVTIQSFLAVKHGNVEFKVFPAKISHYWAEQVSVQSPRLSKHGCLLACQWPSSMANYWVQAKLCWGPPWIITMQSSQHPMQLWSSAAKKKTMFHSVGKQPGQSQLLSWNWPFSR